MKSGRFVRALTKLHCNTKGQLVTEWALVTATVVFPIGLLGPVMIVMLHAYFYRVVGTIALPFP